MHFSLLTPPKCLKTLIYFSRYKLNVSLNFIPFLFPLCVCDMHAYIYANSYVWMCMCFVVMNLLLCTLLQRGPEVNAGNLPQLFSSLFVKPGSP